jgi:chaperonin cofactor prefoldin
MELATKWPQKLSGKRYDSVAELVSDMDRPVIISYINQLERELNEAKERIKELEVSTSALDAKSLDLSLAKMTEERDCWIFNAKELQKQVNKLELRCRELERDKERLDWLDTSNNMASLMHDIAKSFGPMPVNLRQAIDAALLQTKTKGDE